jgi:hypothetical protein
MIGDERMVATLKTLAVGESYRLPSRYRLELTVRNMLASTGYRWTVIEVYTPKTKTTQFTVTRDA